MNDRIVKLREKAISSCYRIDPSKMLTTDESVLTLLEEMFKAEGKTTERGIQKLYQEIQNSLHKDLEDQF